MACREWNTEWVAQLYGELDPAESRQLNEHLRSCDDCRQTLERLAQSREWLRSGIPDVPAPPRVLLLPVSGARRPIWAFASGIAAALLVFAAGLYAGLGLPGAPPRGPSEPATASTALPAVDSAMLDRLAELETEVEVLRAASGSRSSGVAGITATELDDRLAGLERRFQTERVRDVEFLLGEINATEWRAANWVDENREALRLVALRNDPRLSER